MSRYIDAEKIPWTDLNDGRGGVNVYVTFLEKVARMPAADVQEVRHGRWTRYEYSTNNRWRKCSVCGRGDEYINEFGFVAIRNYCPYCGAKMDEVSE